MYWGVRLTNVFIVLIIFIAHFFAPPGYSFITHTMSELAGQGVINAWILTTGFYGVGLAYIFWATYYYRQHQLPFWLFVLTSLEGLTTILLGVFPTSYDGFTMYTNNETFVFIHRYIAYANNFITLSMITVHAAKSHVLSVKIRHVMFLILAFIFSGFFVLIDPEIRGIFQRLILLTTTLWTVTSYGLIPGLSPRSKKQNPAAVNG